MEDSEESALAGAIIKAARMAFGKLFREHPENYYYCSLVTTGDATPPVVSAWSWEALAMSVGCAEGSQEAISSLKWSYADSPYFAFGAEFFDSVSEMFSKRPKMNSRMSDKEWLREYQIRLDAMEAAMSRLDSEGIFGFGSKRDGTVVLVEVMPPDGSNIERAFRLNAPNSLREWLAEAAEGD